MWMSEEDIRRLLSELDKLEVVADEGLVRKSAEGTEVDAENGLSEKEKLKKRKEDLKQLIDVLETEFRESSISEKTYKEAVNRSKEELISIEEKLKKLISEQESDERGGRLLELEKMKIDMQNQINNLTLQFSKAEISDEDYNKKIEVLKSQIQEIEGEIYRLDKGKSVVEAVPMKIKPGTKQEEPKAEGEEKPEGLITQSMEVVPEEKKEEKKPEEEKKKQEEKKEEKPPKDKKPRFSIRSKLFGEKKPKKEEKKDSNQEESGG